MMKKVLSTILGTACILAMALSGAEKPNGDIDLPWSLSCFAVAILCGLAFAKLNPRRAEK